MAGIGFRLQHLMRDGGYFGLARAYLYSAIIATGPWLLSIIGLAILGQAARLFTEDGTVRAFQAIIIYTYAGSLILTGGMQMGATRFLADRLYVGDTAALRPCWHYLATGTCLLSGALAFIALSAQGLEASVVLAGTVLFQAVSLSWVGMLFLTAAKDYMAIVRAFAVGYTFGVSTAIAAAEQFGLAGMLWGFALGQLILVTLLAARIWTEFPSHLHIDRAVLGHLRSMLSLAAVGFFLNLGIWIDKIVFWYMGPSQTQIGVMRLSDRYDTASFLAYVTIVPAMAQFLIRVEVAFYRQYTSFFAVITQGASLERVRESKDAMMAALRLSAWRLIQLQGVVSLLALVFAPQICSSLGITPDHVPVLRLCILGAFTHVLLQITLLIILYFDWQRVAAVLAVGFCALNGLASVATIFMGEAWHGFGYVVACLFTLVIALIVMEKRLNYLVYETFASQAMYPESNKR